MLGRARWPLYLWAPGCLLIAFLCLAAWRLVEQESALERERLRERLENAASLVARESERAYELAAADASSSLSIEWDSVGWRRAGGVPLLWSPAPVAEKEAPVSSFQAGEDLEFVRGELAAALEWYGKLQTGASGSMSAGALARMARCQRKLNRPGEALATYARLAALGAAPVAGAPAELVGLRERAALLESAGQFENSRKERDRLRGALESGAYSIDGATFEFYARGLRISEERLGWAEAVEALRRRAGEAASGSTVLQARSRRFVATWTRENGGGRGTLVDAPAMGLRLAKILETSAIRWQLTDGDGAPLAGSGVAEPKLQRRMGETGLAWGVLVGVAPEKTISGASWLAAGLAGLSLAIAVTLYLAYRAVRRELGVARMQSEFVAAVSHEFRSPITALTHLTDLLSSGETPRERLPLYFGALARETRRLHDMVENLLDFGRMESGRYRYKPEKIEMDEFVAATLDEFREQSSAAGREIVLAGAAGGPPVAADREALRRALWNLLDNAAKYSPAGQRITARLSESRGWVRLSVEDEGPGVAPEERKLIFQKFVRGREAAGGATKGSGMGLALVEAIARAHGGHVELESVPGSGSCFTLVLPRAGRE